MVVRISGLTNFKNSKFITRFFNKINKQLEIKKTGDAIVYTKANTNVKKIRFWLSFLIIKYIIQTAQIYTYESFGIESRLISQIPIGNRLSGNRRPNIETKRTNTEITRLYLFNEIEWNNCRILKIIVENNIG